MLHVVLNPKKRMPIISENLKAPLVTELDITSITRQLKTYIRDDIDPSRFLKILKTYGKKLASPF